MFTALASLLYVVSIAMIVGGGYVAADGSQMFPVDRGMAQYVAGLGIATGGLVLFGIATLIICLGMLNRTFRNSQRLIQVPQNSIPPDRQALADAADAAPFPAVPPSRSARPFINPAPVDQADPEHAYLRHSASAYPSRGFAKAYIAEREAAERHSLTDEEARRLEKAKAELEDALAVTRKFADQPDEDDGSGPEDMTPEGPADSGDRQNFSLSGMQVRERAFEYYSYPEHEGKGGQPVEDARGAAAVGHESHAVDPRMPPADAEVPVEDRSAPAEPREKIPMIVGSYESGGNRYVMYSDGSIVAHLPNGTRTFRSFEELKQFVSTT